MSTRSARNQKLRTILDCVLIILLILVASANRLPAQAKAELQPAARNALVAEGMAQAIPDSAGAQPGSAQPQVDNNTLAAMIAAENAALTLPLYFVDLPVITH